ncbi:hypothetical protein DFJ74DRAFT_717552 [Hyaloraphidium curvatum]|nr:hypothetical protein DFJ74DRAFT_717552 [Hyaloraphidium curvatum]
MPRWICTTCGNNPLRDAPDGSRPVECQICVDERQYVGIGGSGKQEWTTLEEMVAAGRHRNVLRPVRCGNGKLFEMFTVPSFGIGQRALVALTPRGAVMFDSLAYVDAASVRGVKAALGGKDLAAIVVSHPHFYGGMATWAKELGGCPVFVHRRDEGWIPEADRAAVTFWDGEQLPIFGEPSRDSAGGRKVAGAEAVHVGGHFEGSTVCVVELEGVKDQILLSSDSFLPTPRHTSISMMYSFPNLVPLPPSDMLRAWRAVEPYPFGAILGAFPGRDVEGGGREVVRESVGKLLGRMEAAAKL